ncbi:hypothetical protein EV126DRAFT_421364 [Verticillium dahliae]|nr:hypothetical protein EV126DRAFT_421364 [Verticillium dahliae]
MSFTCQHAGCSRVYLRAEHLNRHAKSHDRPTVFTCGKCGSKMTRRDTFRRHMALHGLTVSSNRAPQACLPCRQAKVKCDGQRPACSTCSARSLRCGWSSRSNRTASNDAPATTPQAWKTTNGNSSMRIIEELESSDNYECGGPEDQQSMALSDPNAECPGKRLMYDKLLAIYFDKFHHHWPIVHRELTLSRSVPQVLLRTVVTVGLHLSGNLEAKALADSTLERFLEQSGTTLASVESQAAMKPIALLPAQMFELQAILLQVIMVPYLTDRIIPTGIMVEASLVRVLKLASIYDQDRIDAEAHTHGIINPLVLRESYQRLTLFHFKFHAQFQRFCQTKYTWRTVSLLVDPLLLCIKIPMLLESWDKLSGEVPEVESIDEQVEAVDHGHMTTARCISDMCQFALIAEDPHYLHPINILQPGLGTLIWLWITREKDNTREFHDYVERIGIEHF